MVKLAFEAGYRISKSGDAIAPNGAMLKPMKLHMRKLVYYAFSFRNCKVKYHQLQAFQKFGDAVFKNDCVRHLNGNSLDNSFDNIALGSFTDNRMDISPEERKRLAIEASINAQKYKHSDVIDYYKQGHSYKDIMEHFGITSKGTVSFIINKSMAAGAS